MSTDQTRRAAQTYHQGWAHGSGADEMRPVMAEDFVFVMGEMRIEGREAFLSGGGWPEGATVTTTAEAYEGDHGFQLYECARGESRVQMCEHFIVSDGRITMVELVVDQQQLGAFMASAG